MNQSQCEWPVTEMTLREYYRTEALHRHVLLYFTKI